MSAPTEIRKSILIIKSQAKSLMSVENFLRNRDWKIHSATDVKSALTYMVQNKPSFVMVGVDHPNKKVRALPKLLAQAFPVHIIAFTESSTTMAYKHLLDSGCTYRINPPVTGPAVERVINKLIKDQQDAADRAARGETDEILKDSKEPGTQVMKGDKAPLGVDKVSISGAGPGSFNISSASAILKQISETKEEAEEADALMLEVPTADGSTAAGDALANDPGSLTQEGTKKGPAGMIHQEGKGKGPGGSITQEGMGPGAAGVINQEGPKAARGGIQLNKGDKKDGPDPISQEGTEGQALSARAGKNKGGSGGPLSSSDAASHGEGFMQQPSEEDPDAPLTTGTADRPQARYSEEDFEKKGSAGNDQNDADDVDENGAMLTPEMKKRKKAARAESSGNSEKLDPEALASRQQIKESLNSSVRTVGAHSSSGWSKGDDNIMVRGTQKALDESVNVRDGTVKEKLEESSNVACLIIESAKFSGYLVAAMGKNRKIDKKFMTMIQDRLSKFLAENGEPIKDKDGMAIKIKQVDFEDWAVEYADFLRKSVHEGEEVAMAFFPFAEANTGLTESASADMGSVKIDELKGDIPVEFNLYIYLPANKKYVLYTPRGSKFYGNQKDRLAGMGVSHMHVKRTDLQDVSKYRAQNYLNSKIEEFESRRRTPKAS